MKTANYQYYEELTSLKRDLHTVRLSKDLHPVESFLCSLEEKFEKLIRTGDVLLDRTFLQEVQAFRQELRRALHSTVVEIAKPITSSYEPTVKIAANQPHMGIATKGGHMRIAV